MAGKEVVVDCVRLVAAGEHHPGSGKFHINRLQRCGAAGTGVEGHGRQRGGAVIIGPHLTAEDFAEREDDRHRRDLQQSCAAGVPSG
jgi:hypothetical protein